MAMWNWDAFEGGHTLSQVTHVGEGLKLDMCMSPRGKEQI